MKLNINKKSRNTGSFRKLVAIQISKGSSPDQGVPGEGDGKGTDSHNVTDIETHSTKKCIISFNVHNNPTWDIILASSSFPQWTNWAQRSQ